ncbi:MAG: hypothetical protein QNJ14_00865 [Woeseiaceae bacterium]|nr:hypothetical protein [Woeseiaceae bacterium]
MRCIFAVLGFIALVPAVYGNDVAELQGSASNALAEDDYPTAEAQLSEALGIEPDNAYSLYLMALTYLNRGSNLVEAQAYLDRAEEAGAQPQALSLLRARLYAKQDRVNDALTEIETLAAGGYGQLARLDDQPDFDRLRANARFVKARESIKATRFPCEADERHQDFDFWIGDWNVYQNGTYAGQNRITSLLGGCLIFEQWESASGSLGKSFNYFDPSKNHWRQIWIADTGTMIEFTGEARDGGIYYTAETTDPNTGELTHHRFEFTLHSEGGVRQFWAVSNDIEKGEWTTIWDGHYVPNPDNGM